MYDDFSADYDRFVDWPVRLAAELPFIEEQLQMVEARRVLDAACGTGMHVIALAERGYEVVGADASVGMVERGRVNAAAMGSNVRYHVAGFGELNARAGSGYDAVLCLGNSLPHLLTVEDLTAALSDFAACLRPGGLLLIQNRNFDAVLAHRERWMGPQAHGEGETEWLFLRFYDYEPDGRLTFNLITLRREGIGAWNQRVTATRLWPLRKEELIVAVARAGLAGIACFGDTSGASFDPFGSPNLIITARRADRESGCEGELQSR